MNKRKLTARQERFVEEYLIDLNATQAATDPTGYKVVARASAPAAELPSDRSDTEKGPANPT